MQIAFTDTHHFERIVFDQVNEKYNFDIRYLDIRLTAQTVNILKGADAVCVFANDKLDAECIQALNKMGVKLLVLRSAGFNHVDLEAADRHGIVVARVPSYSPNSVAEFAVGMLMTLNRKIHRSYARVRELNFSLEGLVGFDLHGKTVGVVGTGRIGKIFAQIMTAFGCRVLAYDLREDAELKSLNVQYTDFKTICRESDVISLHVPLNPQTRHLIDQNAIEIMKPNVYLVNTGRGALIDAKALISRLKKQKIGGAALDVYEEEENVFFHDLSGQVLQDDVLARLLTFPNVLITSHQAFLTQEALHNIAETTLQNVDDFFNKGGVSSANRVQVKRSDKSINAI